MHLLGCDEGTALQHMRHRVANMSMANRLMAEFLEVDDIHDVIDRADKQAVEQHKKSSAARSLASQA